MTVRTYAVDRPELEPLPMPDRFRHEITFFASDRVPMGESLHEGEWWVDLTEAEAVLDEGVVRIASPLASEGRAEIELSEEQEIWLEWIVKNGIERVRLE